MKANGYKGCRGGTEGKEGNGKSFRWLFAHYVVLKAVGQPEVSSLSKDKNYGSQIY